ncbi:hypothetical protein Q9R20_13165 [Microbacterium sp. PRF11]|uniref:hypothetical protein n=1 Tax=Microbacterium sp. PRF11 TaxID=2962593 RepID=UPI0028818E29|nr:hypothetical protein [Microbacterium sp. PRF11]MDT0117936.1 hypothetical protein [Microbacterium sp. PRF11]
MIVQKRRIATVGCAMAAALALTLAPAASPAAGAWQASASAPVIALSTGTLAAPTTTCKTNTGLLGLADSATISWAKVPNATSYRLYVGGSTSFFETSALSFDITGTLIISLLGALIGSSTSITVVARTQNWESAPGNAQVIGPSGLAGVRCQNP